MKRYILLCALIIALAITCVIPAFCQEDKTGQAAAPAATAANQTAAAAPATPAPSAAAVTVATAAGLGVFNVIAGEPGAGTQCNLNVPGSNRLNGQPFVVRAGGIISMSAGTYTATIQPLVFASTTAGFTAALGNVIALTAVTAFAYVTYRCIYKKPGTKLLIFCIS